MKPAYYQYYCINSNHILHNTKDNQVLIVGGPNTPPINPKWQTAAILKKKLLSPYIRSRLTAFIKIWYGDAYWHAGDRQLKFRIFENPSWRTAAILKTVKSP